MNAVRSIIKNAPNSIPVPEEFQKKNIEVIFLPIEEEKDAQSKSKEMNKKDSLLLWANSPVKEKDHNNDTSENHDKYIYNL